MHRMITRSTHMFLLSLTAMLVIIWNVILVPVTDRSPLVLFQMKAINDVEHSLLYVQSIKTFQRTLEFLHIPKTAGSTIEQLIAARQGKVAWGMCRYIRWNSTNPKNPCFGTEANWFKRNATQKGQFDALPWMGFPSFWHTPPHLFRLKDNPYQNADIFTVIRDPVDRAMSEFHFQCFVIRRRRPKRLCALGPTSFFESKLKAFNQSTTGEKYSLDDSHFIPQMEFIMRPLEVRQVDYVLRLNLTSMGYEFNHTMRAFDLSLYWPGSHSRSRNAVDRSKHRVKPLEKYMAERLKDFYADDYTMFQ